MLAAKAKAMAGMNLFNSLNMTWNRMFKKPEKIPDLIKPKTRPYTLEILYWGLRNIKDHNYIMVGQQKINVLIEIGDTKLESNVMEKCISNGNFIITHRKHIIVSFL